MVNNNDSFLSKGEDEITATGHAIKTLQNTKIASPQRKPTQLQAATAALQYEGNEQKKRELELLEKQQARQKQAQKEELKAELLELAPKLNQFQDRILLESYDEEFFRGKDIYEADIVLTFLNENKQIIEDINFHEFQNQLSNKQSKILGNFENEVNLFNKYLLEFNAYLPKVHAYLNTVHIIGGSMYVEIDDQATVNQYEKTINELLSNKKQCKELIDKLSEYKFKMFTKEFEFGDKYILLPLKQDQLNIILNFLESININTDEGNKELIGKRIMELKNNIKAKEFLNYLRIKNSDGWNINIEAIQIKLAEINRTIIYDKLLNDLITEINKYKNKIDRYINNIRLTGNYHYNNAKENIIELNMMTGVDADNYLNTLDELKKSYELVTRLSVAMFFGGIMMLLLTLFIIGVSEKPNVALGIIFIFTSIISIYIGKQIKDWSTLVEQESKYAEVFNKYVLKIEELLVNLK